MNFKIMYDQNFDEYDFYLNGRSIYPMATPEQYQEIKDLIQNIVDIMGGSITEEVYDTSQQTE